MSINDNDVLDRVVVPKPHTRDSLAPAMLVAEGAGSYTFYVPALAEGNDDLFVSFDIVTVDLKNIITDLGSTLVTHFFLQAPSLLLDHKINLVWIVD